MKIATQTFLEKEDRARLDAAAKAAGRSVASLVRLIVLQWLGKMEAEK